MARDDSWANRTPFIIAAVGSWLASAYWALLTALTFLTAITGGELSGFRALLPLVLIVLYAVRGFGALRGDPRSLNSLTWLHGIGAVATLINSRDLSGLALGLNAVKIAINLFGAVSAFMAMRTLQTPNRPPPPQ
jgi:hypothetical protein